MIKSLWELLVEHFEVTQRQAISQIKKGVVYVDDVRVANTDALLVYTRGAHIRMGDKSIDIGLNYGQSKKA